MTTNEDVGAEIIGVRLTVGEKELLSKAALVVGEEETEFGRKALVQTARLTLDISEADVQEHETVTFVVEVLDVDVVSRNVGYVMGYVASIINSYLHSDRTQATEAHVVEITENSEDEDEDSIATVTFGPGVGK